MIFLVKYIIILNFVNHENYIFVIQNQVKALNLCIE